MQPAPRCKRPVSLNPSRFMKPPLVIIAILMLNQLFLLAAITIEHNARHRAERDLSELHNAILSLPIQ